MRFLASSMMSTSRSGSSPASIYFSILMAFCRSSTVRPFGLMQFSFVRQYSNNPGDWQFLCSDNLVFTISAFFCTLIFSVFFVMKSTNENFFAFFWFDPLIGLFRSKFVSMGL